MIVTDKNYSLEKFVVHILDLIIERACKKRKLDALLLIDGDEGFGKTGLSILIAYYISFMSGREFSLDNIYFEPEKFLHKVNNSKKQILIWDESALGGLASGWQNKIQQMMIQTLMTCRFRQHIIIFNCPKFYRLNQYFVTDRSVGLFHVYSRDGIKAGRLTFYKKDWLEGMLQLWSKKRLKPYKKYAHKMFRGSFVDAFNLDIINEDDYDDKKTKATSELLEKFKVGKDSKTEQRMEKFRYIYATMEGMTDKEKADRLGISTRTISRWKELNEKNPLLATVKETADK